MPTEYKQVTREAAFEVEELCNTARKVLQSQFALEQAILHGEIDSCNYEWCFILITDAAHDLVKRLDVLRTKLFTVVKADIQKEGEKNARVC